MKIVNFKNQKIRLLKGQSLVRITEYGRGKWAKPRTTLAVVVLGFFGNGNLKVGRYEKMIKEIAVEQEGYTWDIWKSMHIDVIASADPRYTEVE